jgi:hypothetical protein
MLRLFNWRTYVYEGRIGPYITLTSLFVLVLGQCAALPPARRAARVPPAEAMRIVPS